MNPRTHVILDGLQDPLLARSLSAAWARAGLENAVDVAGQAAWLRVESTVRTDDGMPAARTDDHLDAAPGAAWVRTADPAASDLQRAAGIARAFGVELRDRVGVTFKSDNDLPALREQITREYRGRFAQALVFGLPAVVIHHLGPMLASGGGQTGSSMAFPWLLELALVGWSMWVAGLPVLWQGVMSAIHLRATADLLVAVIVLAAFLPSAAGVMSLLFTDQPWFGVPTGVDGRTIRLAGPAFHIAMMAVMIVTFQRWQLHRNAARLAGRANLMMPRLGVLIAAWLAAMAGALVLAGWHVALSLALLLPPMLSAGAINRRSSGWSFALPVIAFVPVFLVGPRSAIGASAAGLQFEIAAAFAWMMSLVMALGWRRLVPLTPEGK